MQVRFRRLRSIDPEAFAADIDSLAITTNPSGTLDGLVTQYNDCLCSLIEKHAPLVSKTVVLRPSAPWISETTRQSKRAKRRAERIFSRRGLTVDLETYREARRRHSNLLANARTAYVSSKVNECGGDSKRLFSLVSSMIGSPSTRNVPKRASDSAAAAELADFFNSKVAKIRHGLDAAAIAAGLPSIQPHLPSAVADSPHRLAAFRPLISEDVRKLVVASPNKSCCLDPIPTTLLKLFIDHLLTPITAILNLSLSTGTFPAAFKHAAVSPLLKKPNLDPDNPENYRPVSNLPFLSKLIERAVFAQLSEHLSVHSLLPDRQSAYRQNYSTETTLLGLRNDMLLAADAGHGSAVVLLDLSAAFDTIDHDVLLDRLNIHCGFADTALSWFTSYLRDRTQIVKIGSASSHSTTNRFGVPQGSVLGGTLFTIYIGSLPTETEVEGVTIDGFSDDNQARITLSLTPNPPSSQSSDPFFFLSSWCINCERFFLSTRVKLNITKTVFFLAGPKNLHHLFPPAPLIVGALSIPSVSQCRNLGVILDSGLTMEPQVRSVCKSALYHLRLIARIRRFLNSSATKALVHALVLSRIDYCNSLYAGLPTKALSSLQRVVNAAARLTLRKGRRQSASPLLKELGWLPAKERIIAKVTTLAYRCRLSPPLAPAYISSLLSEHVPARSLRSSSTISLSVPRVRLAAFGQRSFSFLAPTLFNSLPPSSIRVTQSKHFQSTT